MTSTQPELARGGILADDMGLGKTLQYSSLSFPFSPSSTPSHIPLFPCLAHLHLKLLTNRIISLLVADPTINSITPLPIPPSSKGTLIISPLSLISNWTSQLTAHLFPDTLSILVFYGAAKSDPSIDLKDYDVVITTYGALVSDYKASGLEKGQGKAGGGGHGGNARSSKRGLFGRVWRRVVLDEAHVIRNSRAKVSLAVSGLSAAARWSLTGNIIPISLPFCCPFHLPLFLLQSLSFHLASHFHLPLPSLISFFCNPLVPNCLQSKPLSNPIFPFQLLPPPPSIIVVHF